MGFNYYSVSWWSNWWTISWTRDVYSFMIWTPSWFNITCNYVWASCWPVPCITTSVNVCCATTASVYFSSFSNNCIYGWSYFTFLVITSFSIAPFLYWISSVTRLSPFEPFWITFVCPLYIVSSFWYSVS